MLIINNEIKNNKPILKLTSPIPVSVNHYMKPRGILKWKGSKPFAMAMMYETSEAKKYKKDFMKYINQEVKNQNWDRPIDSNTFFIIDSYFYFDRIDVDANNYYKIMLDAITDTQLIWKDDNITMERVQRIYYDKENPRIELLIYPADYIGIFDNVEDFNNFKNSYCNNCKRGSKIGQKGGCSVFKSAIESRITNDIDLNTKECNKFKSK